MRQTYMLSEGRAAGRMCEKPEAMHLAAIVNRFRWGRKYRRGCASIDSHRNRFL